MSFSDRVRPGREAQKWVVDGIKRLEAEREEQFRSGFWWGFERARMQPKDSNIRVAYEEVRFLILASDKAPLGDDEEDMLNPNFAWCYKNPADAADLIARLTADRDAAVDAMSEAQRIAHTVMDKRDDLQKQLNHLQDLATQAKYEATYTYKEVVDAVLVADRNQTRRAIIMSNKTENNVGTPEPSHEDSTLTKIVDEAERCAPAIRGLRHRIEGVLSRMVGPNENPTAEDKEAAGSLLERLDDANTRNSSEISQLETEIFKLEALA